MGKLVTEFIGTFFLMFTIALTTISPGATTFAPFAIGLVLMIMVYAGGHISGAHYNPAVTLGVLLRGKCSLADVIPYTASQLLAAIAGALVAVSLKTDAQLTPLTVNVIDALLVEVLFTFALVTVVLNVATARATVGNSFFGFAIGGTVAVGAVAAGGISGGVFNPAVGVGLACLGILPLGMLLAYIGGQLGAAILASVIFRLTNREEFALTQIQRTPVSEEESEANRGRRRVVG